MPLLTTIAAFALQLENIPELTADWSKLPGVPTLRRPDVHPNMTSFVMNEYSARRCKFPLTRQVGGTRGINVPVALLIAPDGAILAAVPANIGCPRVEAYAAEQVKRSHRKVVKPIGGSGPVWHRTVIGFSWG